MGPNLTLHQQTGLLKESQAAAFCTGLAPSCHRMTTAALLTTEQSISRKNWYLPSAYSVPSTVLGALPALLHLLFSQHWYSLHHTEEKTRLMMKLLRHVGRK